MAKSSLKKNYIYNLIYQIFLLIVPIFVTPYIARVLGSDGSGVYAFSFSIVSYFTIIAALGFSIYGQRAIARVQNDIHQRSVILYEIVIARLIPTILTTLLYILLNFLNVYGEIYQNIISLMVIFIIATAFDITFYFQGLEEFGKIAILNIIIKGLSIVSIFVFVKNENDLWIYTLIQALTGLCCNFFLCFFLKGKIDNVKFSELNIKKHFLPAFLLFIPSIATTLYTSLDKTMIGFITGNPAENGNYDYADRIVKMGLTVISSLGIVMVSRNSSLYEKKDIIGFKGNINKTIRFVFAAGIPIFLGLICIADNLIPWYLGEGYDKASTLLKILSPIVLIIGLSNVLGMQCLIPSREDKKYTIAIFAGVVVNLLINFILIYYFESEGAAISTIIAETVVLIMMTIFCKKYIEFKSLLKGIWKYAFSGLLMGIICFAEAYFLEPSILNTILISLTGALAYFLLLLILRDSLFISYLKYFYQLTKKFFKIGNGDVKNMKKKFILVTGINGQLGHDVFNELKERGYKNVVGIDINELDITDEKAVHEFVRNYKPDIIMHNAAWTAVDKAEENEEKVYAVNALGTKYLAEAAKEVGAKLMYISTDYVFDGKGENFFEIDSPKNGLSVYGKTKSKGEDFVISTLKEYWIIRISWVFGINGNNFIRTMLKLAKAGKKELNVVDDQIGSPAYTYDLAKLMCDMIETNKYGVYHATNEGICSWYEFAKYIFEKTGYADIKVNPVSTSEYKKLVPNQADRPLNSRLSKKSLDEAGFKHLPDWHDAVDRYIEELKEKGEF